MLIPDIDEAVDDLLAAFDRLEASMKRALATVEEAREESRRMVEMLSEGE